MELILHEKIVCNYNKDDCRRIYERCDGGRRIGKNRDFENRIVGQNEGNT